MEKYIKLQTPKLIVYTSVVQLTRWDIDLKNIVTDVLKQTLIQNCVITLESMVLKSLLRSMKVNLLAAANNGVAFWDVIDANNEWGEGF